MSTILLINPNSSRAFTDAMRQSIRPILGQMAHEVTSIELAKSPEGVETDAHVEQVIPNILEAVSQSPADAYVIGCFSDPGIAQTRAITPHPVVGIAESAYTIALSLGQRFGVVSLGPSSIGRHQRQLDRLGLLSRLAGDRSIDMTVAETLASDIFDRLLQVGKALRQDGADVIVLGCAGLGGYRKRLEAELGLPFVDPVQAGLLVVGMHLDLFGQSNDQ